MKYRQITSWFLGISMFMFGVLKFFDPFKGWYAVQITNSGLGELSYYMGILGEIFVGLTLVLCLGFKPKMEAKSFVNILSFAFLAIMIMMATGIYVHFHPEVPAEVLPLGIKPPFIPMFFFILAFINLILIRKKVK